MIITTILMIISVNIMQNHSNEEFFLNNSYMEKGKVHSE